MASNIILLKSNGNTYGFTSIQTAINSGSDGDCVVVYNNTYNENINLKNGVNLYALPGVVISGSEIAGTLRDNGNRVNITFDGRAKLYNSNGNQYEVVLTNVNSTVDRYNKINDSTIFGKTQNDIHQFTGSLNINQDIEVSGSLSIKNQNVISKNKIYYTTTQNDTLSSIIIDGFDNNYMHSYKMNIAGYCIGNSGSVNCELSGIFLKSASDAYIYDSNVILISTDNLFTGSVSSSLNSTDYVVHIQGRNNTTTKWSITLQTNGVYIE